MKELNSKFINNISKLDRNNIFVNISKYKNEFNEISNFQIYFCVNYIDLIKKSLDKLNNYHPLITDCKDFSFYDLRQAKSELVSSFKDTLNGYNPRYTCHNVYEPITNKNNVVPGVKLHINQNILHLEGVLLNKVILSSGSYTEYDSNTLTKAKNFLRKKLPVDKWRQFKLDLNKFNTINIQKRIYLPRDILESI